MDTMTATKYVAAGCGALLVFLLLGWGAEIIYEPHHGSEQAYVIQTEDDAPEDEPASEPEPVVPIADLIAVADASDGEAIWRSCRTCHQIGEGAQNGTGPYLTGVVGREIGSVDGFRYSDTLAGYGEPWTYENLSGFLEAPSEWAPGTRMVYRGLDDAEDRAALIKYLEGFPG